MQRKTGKRTGILLTAWMLFFSCHARASEIVIPDGTTAIEAEAFANCSAVQTVVIPDTVTAIGENAFLNCGEAMLIRAGAGSAGAAYAQANRIDYMAGTEYRALVIAQTYPGTIKELAGPANDARAVSRCLQNLSTTPFTVRTEENLSPDGMISAISSCFAAADSNDVSLVYYSGHGEPDGSLLGADEDFSTLPPTQLRAALDSIPGRKVVIVDACYSGKLISEEDTGSGTLRGERTAKAASDEAGAGAENFVNAFQAAFRYRLRGALNSDLYFVITAARETEMSMEDYIYSGGMQACMGVFTFGFCRGCGWDGPANQSCGLLADRNGDRAVSIQEAYAYARSIALTYNRSQSAAVWPADCRWFAPIRK